MSSGFATLALFLCVITRDRFQAIAYTIADCYSLRHASHLLLLCYKLAGKVPLVLVTVSASHASVLLKRQFKLLLHRLVYEDFLTHLKSVALQIPHDRSRFDYSGILAECIVASKHVTQLLALLVLWPGLVSRDHEYVFGGVRLDLALDFLGQCIDDLLDELAVLHLDCQSLFVCQHRVAFDEHQSLVLSLKFTLLLLCHERRSCLILC